MPIIQRPYVPPDDQIPQDDSFVNPGATTGTNATPEEASLDPITFYSDSMHIFSSLYSAVLFFGEQMEEREPLLRARIKVRAGTQWGIKREFNRRMKNRFDELGIEIPFPQQTITFGEDKEGNAVAGRIVVEDKQADDQPALPVEPGLSR